MLTLSVLRYTTLTLTKNPVGEHEIQASDIGVKMAKSNFMLDIGLEFSNIQILEKLGLNRNVHVHVYDHVYVPVLVRVHAYVHVHFHAT